MFSIGKAVHSNENSRFLSLRGAGGALCVLGATRQSQGMPFDLAKQTQPINYNPGTGTCIPVVKAGRTLCHFFLNTIFGIFFR